jgi:cyclin-dependent kinase regulatory subunit CKS1
MAIHRAYIHKCLNGQIIKTVETIKNLKITKMIPPTKNFYRHVILPKPLAKYVPSDRLLPEREWRELGLRQSPGWHHYMIHAPEPHVLLFRREKNYQQKYGPLGQNTTNACGAGNTAAANIGNREMGNVGQSNVLAVAK